MRLTKLSLSLIFILLFSFISLIHYLPDFLWFKSFDFSHVWIILVASKLAIFFVSFVVTSAVLLLNLAFVNRNAASISADSIRVETRFSGLNAFLEQFLRQTSSSAFVQTSSKYYNRLLMLGAIGISGFISLIFMSKWHLISFYFNQVPYGLSDPYFGKDIGFYLFSLPFFTTFLTWVTVVLGVALLFSGWVYFTRNILIILFSSSHRASFVKVHLFILIGALFVCFGLLNYFNIYELLFSSRGAVLGIGYTDDHVLIPAIKLFSGLLFAAAALFLINAFQKTLRLPLLWLALLGITYILGLGIFPNLVQSYVVKPNEINKERPYIEKNIAFTRHAYDLNKIQNKDFPVSNTLNRSDIDENQTTMKNVRLWNTEPLKKIF